MKAVKLKRDANEAGRTEKILFLTHSWSMAEQIDDLVQKLDHFPEGPASLEVYPLLEIARRRNYSEIGRQSLGIDSEDGKRKALVEITELLESFKAGDWLAFRGGCTKSFTDAVEASQGSRKLFYFDMGPSCRVWLCSCRSRYIGKGE